MKDFLKKSFFAGFIALLPIAGTIWLLKVIIVTAESTFQSFIPPQWRPANWIGYDIPGIGILAAVIIVLLVGMLTRLYFGRKLLSYGDRIFHKIPLGRGIYRAIKQFLGTITGEGKKSFRQVVLLEYPCEGTYALGFLTGYSIGEVQDKTPENMANIFLPTTPNPTSGYLLLVPERKLIFLNMAIEDAFKFIVSGGVVVKGNDQTLEPEPGNAKSPA